MKRSSLKRCLAVFYLLAALCAAHAQPSLVNKRVLWSGDSISQAGDYVTFVEYYLEKQHAADNIDVVQHWAGERDCIVSFGEDASLSTTLRPGTVAAGASAGEAGCCGCVLRNE